VQRNLRYAIVASLSVLILLLIPTHTWRQAMTQMEKFGFPFIAVFSAALIAMAIDPARQATRIVRFFRTRGMRLLGKYSYAIYVFHFPVMFYLLIKGFTIQSFPRLGRSELPGALAYTLIGMSISVSLAFLSWHLYEKHFLKLKRFFPRREAAGNNGKWKEPRPIPEATT